MQFLSEIFYKPDWIAIQAIATFLVVVVALLPIFRDYFHRMEIAKNLRSRILSELMILSHQVECQRSKYPNIRDNDLVLLGKYIGKLEILFPQAHILTAKEHDLLTALLLNLLVFGRTALPDLQTISHLSDLLKQTFYQIEKKGFLKGSFKNLNLPWEGKGNKEGKRVKDEPKIF
jgi:hypothetical protein